MAAVRHHHHHHITCVRGALACLTTRLPAAALRTGVWCCSLANKASFTISGGPADAVYELVAYTSMSSGADARFSLATTETPPDGRYFSRHNVIRGLDSSIVRPFEGMPVVAEGQTIWITFNSGSLATLNSIIIMRIE